MINEKIVQIDVKDIIPNKSQPRKTFDDKALEELSMSIDSVGFIQPITVRKLTDGLYELVAGERRLKAAKLLNLDKIPAIMSDVNDKDSATIALIENLQREDLNYMEEAVAYEKIIQVNGFTQQQLAEKVGKTQSTVANKLRLLKLPKKIQDMLLENNLSERHARALLKIEDEELMISVLEKIIKKDLNVSQTDKLIKEISENLNKSKSKNKQYVRNFINYKIYINTIKNAYDEICKTGIDAKFEEKDLDDYIELKVRIPKKNVK